MRRLAFFVSAALLSSATTLIAQNQIETFSVYDVNHENGVTVSDATQVVSRVIQSIQEDPQVVDASLLNEVLRGIDQKLQGIEDLTQAFSAFGDRLKAIEEKLGIVKDDDNNNDEDDSPIEDHAYVDLGLTTTIIVDGQEQVVPIYWATCNIGAENPEDAGLYFAWGETEGFTRDTNDGRSFTWTSYKFCDGAANTMKKYCTSSKYGTVDDKTVLEPEDDAAAQIWKGSWRMPTAEEMNDLQNKCTWTWDTINKGYKISKKGTTEPYIFLPAAGHRSVGSFYSSGRYWTSSLSLSDSNKANGCDFSSTSVNVSDFDRRNGLPIRPVCVMAE